MDYNKPGLLHPEGDPNQTVQGFNFNRNDFEDLIDNFTPFEDIPILLGVQHAKLDEFCNEIYNMNFKVTYDTLVKRAELYYRKAMFSLSKAGNPTAIKVSSEFYVGLGRVNENDNRITFIGMMPTAPSDVDSLKDSLQQDAIKKINEEFGQK